MLNTLGEVVTCAIAIVAVLVVPAAIIRAWFPVIRERVAGMIMSRSQNVPMRTSYEPTEPMAVLVDTHQPELEEPDENEPAPEPVYLRQLPRVHLIVLLAVQRKEEGSYLFSANEITSFVGGTAAPVKKLIAEVRAEKQEEPKQPGRVDRPANGWRVKAS